MSRREEQFSKFFDIFKKNRNKYPICKGNQPNASLCKIFEGNTEQEKEDS